MTSELTRSHVLPPAEPKRIRYHALTRKQVVGPSVRSLHRALPRCETDRSDPVRVPKGDEPEPCDHHGTSVGSDDLGHGVSDGGEDVFFIDSDLARLLEVVGEDVEQELRVRVGVDVSVGVRVEEPTELFSVVEVSVLREATQTRRGEGGEREAGRSRAGGRGSKRT